jgi:glycosyltransferase involved in cell wall biosynthesis
MRAAIDATPLTLTSGGLARYARELSLALAAAFPLDEFVLVSDQVFELPSGAPPNLAAGRGPRNALERRWWIWGLDRELERLSAGVFHGTNFAVPYIPRRPSVLTLHDLSPWMETEWRHAAERVRSRTPLLIELGCATMIVTDTEAVRRQAVSYFRIHPSRVAAVPLGGLPPSARPAPRGEEGGAPYFLFVGALERRKNIGGLLAAWRAVRRSHAVDLVLAGRRREDFPPLAPEPGLRVLGEVPDERLPELYAGAVALVYPSRYEGFGLPVLEAMQCGAFAIVSRDPALLEVAGEAAVVADGEKELAGAMTVALTQPGRVREWKEKAARRAADFSWEITARLTYEVYEEARRRFGE